MFSMKAWFFIRKKNLCTNVIVINILFNSTYSQDDTTFEKQSALFALAISDIVLINM